MFFTIRLEMHVRCDNQYKTEADRGNILGQPILFECMGVCVLCLAHESKMRGYLVYVLIVKYLLILFKFSQYVRLDGLIVNFWGDFLKTVLQGSVDHIIYRDYIVNRRSFIYCSLACPPSFVLACLTGSTFYGPVELAMRV